MSSRCGGVDSDSSDGECESDDDEVSSCLEFGRARQRLASLVLMDASRLWFRVGCVSVAFLCLRL